MSSKWCQATAQSMGHDRCIDPMRRLATLNWNPNSLTYRLKKLIRGTKGPAADTNFSRKLGSGLENHHKNQLHTTFRGELAAEVTVSNESVQKFPTKTRKQQTQTKKGRQNCNKIATQIATKSQHKILTFHMTISRISICSREPVEVRQATHVPVSTLYILIRMHGVCSTGAPTRMQMP